MKNAMEEAIRADLASSFGLRGDSVTPVSGGWMNRKWKLVCGGKEWLVKQYSRKRFSQKQLDWIEQSMQRQIIAQREGGALSTRTFFSGKGSAHAGGRHHLYGHGILSGRDAGSQYRYNRSDVFAG